jgi:small subunit ribosomal protein S21
MQILVRDNNVDQALRALKKKLQREGVYREMKLRRHYEKPSEKRAREKAAADSPRPQAGAQASWSATASSKGDREAQLSHLTTCRVGLVEP